MKMTVIGCGYLGAVHAVCMASLGHEVVGIDVDQAKVRALSAGKAPFHEPGLEEMIAAETASGRLRFTAEPTAQDLSGAGIHFITVGTPQSDEGGSADLSHLMGAVSMLTELLDPAERTVVVGKSTVPVGTAHIVEEKLAGTAAALAWNPEFLREGYAVEDTLRPTRLVYGLSANADSAFRGRNALDEAYRPIIEAGCPVIVDSFSTAELVKVAANSFLATKISFINAMAHLCDTAGADVTVLADAIGHDPRIGRRFLQAGVGFGGGCLPKDIRALQASADLHGAVHLADLLGRVDSINREQRDRIVELARTHVGGELSGKAITILGAAFKPMSDDVRDSPALDVASRLADLGAEVTVCDPQALPVVARSHPHLTLEDDPHAALKGAELVLLLTEWDQFVALDPAEAATGVAERVIIDGRNALDPVAWREAGWTYAGVGR